MSEPEIPALDSRSRWRKLEARLEAWFIAICLYICSIGPLYWAWVSSLRGESSRVLQVIYAPLWFAAWLIPPFGRWLMWYIELWIF